MIRQVQTRVNFERVHNGQSAAAIVSRDYLKLRTVVADRAHYFDLNARLGVPLPSDYNKFERSTRGLLDAFADAVEAMPNRTRAQYCGADFTAVGFGCATTILAPTSIRNRVFKRTP